MARKKTPEELTVEELRQLLIEKQRKTRQRRLEHYRKTGRVIWIEPQASPASIDQARAEAQDDATEEAESAPARRRAPRWADRLLLFVEIAAVIGLALIAWNGLSAIDLLNREVASALQQPTLTPTPLISAVVLPSGHTSPDDPGGVRFNEAEIPEHLRPLVQSLADLPLPTPSPAQAVRIQIPAIAVDAPVVQGDDWEQLKKGVGQHLGTPNPGEKGNLVLSAHNDVFGEIFRNLDQLKTGDKIVILTQQRAYTYVVEQSQIVEPSQVEVMAPTENANVTLVSCYPYRVNKQRIIISAHLEN